MAYAGEPTTSHVTAAAVSPGPPHSQLSESLSLSLTTIDPTVHHLTCKLHCYRQNVTITSWRLAKLVVLAQMFVNQNFSTARIAQASTHREYANDDFVHNVHDVRPIYIVEESRQFEEGCCASVSRHLWSSNRVC